MGNPWERQAWESDREHSWLSEYLHAGVRRSFRALASRAGCPYSPSQLHTIAHENGWELRAQAWDRHLAAIRISATEAYVAETAAEEAARHRRFTRLSLDLATTELEKLWQASQLSNMPGGLRPETAVRMGEVAVKTDRLIRGQSTENTKVTADLTHLTDDELTALDRALDKAS